MIEWEKLESSEGTAARAKVPGGWLVRITLTAGDLHGSFSYPPPHGVLGSDQTGYFGNEFGTHNWFTCSSLSFYPDPTHAWTGDSLP
jgi:hypothetical protein